MTALFITGIALFYIILLVGLILIPLGFPGTWVMVVAAVVYALLADLNPGGSEWIAVIIVALLAGLGELIELGVRIVGGKVAKVSNGAIIAAIVGGIMGALIGVPIFLIGSLIGLLLGVFLGAFLYALIIEKNNTIGSFWVALATTTSQVVALFAKTCLGIAIIVYLTVVLF
jgi:hypothetical protein